MARRLVHRPRPMTTWSSSSTSSRRPGLHQLGRDAEVLPGRARVAARVVVGDDDRSSAAADGVAIDLTDAHRRARQVAAIDGPLAHHHVLRVQQQDAQLFPFQRSHGVDEWLGHVGRRPHHPWSGRGPAGDPSCELERRRQPGADRAGKPGDAQLDGVRAHHRIQRPETIEQATRRPARGRPTSEQHRQQHVVVARLRPVALDPVQDVGAGRVARERDRDRRAGHGGRRYRSPGHRALIGGLPLRSAAEPSRSG